MECNRHSHLCRFAIYPMWHRLYKDPIFDGRSCTVEFDTKIALVVRSDLALWQKLNVTAFLTSGIVGTTEGIMGEPYRDSQGGVYHPLVIQPMIILAATAEELTRTCRRAADREVRVAVYIEEMFTTGHDEANRTVVSAFTASELPLVGLSMRAERKVVDKITKGLKLHS